MSTRRSTRWPLVVAVLISLAAAAPAAELDFPYQAYVNADDVYVRSGPGRDYYPTDKLRKGQAIEVYRHDPGGWLAIRPPRGSFSWVSSRNLKLSEDDLAVVDSQRVVPARVGSAFSDMRDVIQVRLERDEKVVLLEPPKADSIWCKIAPPAGEFRWVFAKYVERDLPADLAVDAREAGPAYREDDRVRLTGGDDKNDFDPNDAREFAGDIERLRELDRIDFELTEIVAKDISQWSFDALHQRAASALEAAQGSLERGRARVLLDKLVRFDDIKKRHDALQSAPPAGPQTTLDARTAWSRVDDRRFDGVGRLSPVVSQTTGGPQYALMDEKGAVLSFVTPAPGVNLRPYVDKQVGVNGQRGYLTDLKRQHISVQRVTLLDATRR